MASLLLPGGRKTSPREKSLCGGSLSAGSVIVYVWRQHDAEAVAENLQAAGVSGGIVVYHGGMDASARTKAQSRFMRGKARICVATVAFGLGIDKQDIRGVVHMYLSASPENYLQEIGRAGRDGAESSAVALVLEKEVLVRHSVSHSDMISKSQIRELFSLISDEFRATRALLSVSHTEPLPGCIGLPLPKCLETCSMTPETVETVISLLEQRDDPIFTFEGTGYDRALVAPRRCSLHTLAAREPVVDAIVKCSKCVEAPAGEINEDQPDPSSISASFRQSSVSQSHGSYSFSVIQCARVMGREAEPRHVFAALRRLQNCGEIDLVLDTTDDGKALNIRLTSIGCCVFGGESEAAIDELVSWCNDVCLTTVRQAARKVADMNYILGRLARVPRCASTQEKTSSLLLFQELVQEYFEAEGRSEPLARAAEDLPHFEQVVSETLRTDVRSVLGSLRDAMAGKPSRLLECGDPDYFSLVATKFLHGIAPSAIPRRTLQSIPLFGQYQSTRFEDLHEAIRRLV